MNCGTHTPEPGALNTAFQGMLQGLQSVGGRSVKLSDADELAQLTGSYESVASMGGVLLQEDEDAAIRGSRLLLNQLLSQLRP
jgi:hypothetical protein